MKPPTLLTFAHDDTELFHKTKDTIEEIVEENSLIIHHLTCSYVGFGFSVGPWQDHGKALSIVKDPIDEAIKDVFERFRDFESNYQTMI